MTEDRFNLRNEGVVRSMKHKTRLDADRRTTALDALDNHANGRLSGSGVDR